MIVDKKLSNICILHSVVYYMIHDNNIKITFKCWYNFNRIILYLYEYTCSNMFLRLLVLNQRYLKRAFPIIKCKFSYILFSFRMEKDLMRSHQSHKSDIYAAQCFVQSIIQKRLVHQQKSDISAQKNNFFGIRNKVLFWE